MNASTRGQNKEIDDQIDRDTDSRVFFPTRIHVFGPTIRFFVPASFLGGTAKPTWSYVVAVSGADVYQEIDIGAALKVTAAAPDEPHDPADRAGQLERPVRRRRATTIPSSRPSSTSSCRAAQPGGDAQGLRTRTNRLVRLPGVVPGGSAGAVATAGTSMELRGVPSASGRELRTAARGRSRASSASCAVGSMARRWTTLPDRWSDHDFFVVAAPGTPRNLSATNLDWLPRHGRDRALVPGDRARRQGRPPGRAPARVRGLRSVDELALARMNRYRVPLRPGEGRGSLERVAQATPELAGPGGSPATTGSSGSF